MMTFLLSVSALSWLCWALTPEESFPRSQACGSPPTSSCLWALSITNRRHNTGSWCSASWCGSFPNSYLPASSNVGCTRLVEHAAGPTCYVVPNSMYSSCHRPLQAVHLFVSLHDVSMQPLCKAGSQMREAREEYENSTKDIMGLVIIAKNEALR